MQILMKMVIAGLVTLVGSHTAVAGLKPAVSLGPTASRSLPIVVVFIANETDASSAEAENNAVLVHWLKNFGSRRSIESARNIEFDATYFKKFINADIADIKSGVVGDRTRALSAVIFTNRLAKAGRFEYLRAGRDTSFQAASFLRPRDRHFMADNNPFATEGGFREALRLTANLFDPQAYRFVLITKSHGSDANMMRPKVMLDTDRFNEAEFKQRLAALKDAASHGDAQLKPGLGGEGRTGAEGYEGAFTLENVALTKDQYAEGLLDARDDFGLHFDVAFAFACNTQLKATQIAKFTSHGISPIALFYGSDADGLDYDDISLRAVFQRYHDGTDFVRSLTGVLNDKAGR